MAVRKRAINEKDKLRRREKILKTAWLLYEKSEGTLPTVSEIARKAGLSKGSVYLYFKTKNEIFLSLYMHQLKLWHDSVAETLENHPGKISVSGYARLSSQYIIENTLVLKMGSIANSLFEGDDDEGMFLKFKIQLAGLLDARSQMTCRLFPGLSADQWVKVHLRIYALIFGLWQMFYSPRQVKKLLQEAQIDIFEPDFSESVIESVTTFLNGALQKGPDRPV
ncbi:TetR family transcriptional regulator [Desulfospira joergensenii]|uniref:TetR family transcriptional regulator n=1 Tax=Desulfospira joergensenii TaxID=53329 RepID=UPI0003B48A7D|nr:TetR family transcriptional regulator [Desulfospira joergensenii]